MGKEFKHSAAYCEPCQKFLYISRKSAKTVGRVHGRKAHMSVYPCPEVPSMFHIGHLAKPVITGDTTRKEVYRRNAS